MIEGSINFYFQYCKISFQVFHVVCLLELIGGIREDVHNLPCWTKFQECLLASVEAAPPETLWLGACPSPVYLITLGVQYPQNYISLNLWGEDQKHLLGMFCKQCVAQLFLTQHLHMTSKEWASCWQLSQPLSPCGSVGYVSAPGFT